MPIDTSMYANVQQPQFQSPLDTMQKAMQVSELGMQYRQQQYQLQSQMATRKAIADNTDAQGNLDQQGALSDLGKAGYGQQAMQLGSQWNQMAEQKADMQAKQVDAASKGLQFLVPAMQYMNGVKQSDPSQMPQVYASTMKDLQAKGVDTSRLGDQYDPQLFQASFDKTMAAVPAATQLLNNQKTQADTALAQANIPWTAATKGAELQSSLYGSRSPNAEITSQFSGDPRVKNARTSQVALNQMMDSHQNKTPQGDASLVLQNFIIRNPGVPDVNSIEEMKTSQAVPDAWKNKLNQAINGGLDDNTRDNLMRDGISAFRANYGTFQGAQKEYLAKAQQQGVPKAQGIVADPGMDQTNAKANGLQKQLGSYAPPSQRGGISGWTSKLMSTLTGTSGGNPSANASEKPAQSQYRAAGSPVSADQVAQYATKHNLSLKAAQSTLKGFGYAIGN